METNIDQLMGLHAAAQQLKLKHEHASKFPDTYTPQWLLGYRESYWTVQHLIGETLMRSSAEVRADFKRRTGGE